MARIDSMTAGQMAELMGDVATHEEGEAMLVLMRERGFDGIEDIPDEEWLPMLDEAVRRASERGYVVIHHPEGGAAEYIGVAGNKESAHALVDMHERGVRAGTPQHLWETARASGSRVPGCDYPDIDPDEATPDEWVGDDGCYAIYEV